MHSRNPPVRGLGTQKSKGRQWAETERNLKVSLSVESRV